MIPAMKLTDFRFELPPELIAQFPMPDRTASRLLALDGTSGEWQDYAFRDLLKLLNPEDLLVFNNTKVIPARLLGQKETGGKVEVLIERILDEHRVLAHLRSSKSPQAGRRLVLEQQLDVEVLGRQGELFELQFHHPEDITQLLQRYGRMPLPPYIDREVAPEDNDRYQTVYAEQAGAVAAPTAGLHFDEALLEEIAQLGIETAHITLHVGAGTFQTVRVDDIEQHQMHAERIEVSEQVCQQINQTRQRGGRVIAVGTTSVRALESASQTGEIQPFYGETDIFIYPGYQFQQVDAMITNFHLSESTLLMLVSAFAGREHILKAYQHAVEARYRFFSYGDAMFINRKQA